MRIHSALRASLRSVARPARRLRALVRMFATLRAKSRASPGCATDIRLRAHMRAHMPRRRYAPSRNDRGESSAAAAIVPACHCEEPVLRLVTWQSVPRPQSLPLRGRWPSGARSDEVETRDADCHVVATLLLAMTEENRQPLRLSYLHVIARNQCAHW